MVVSASPASSPAAGSCSAAFGASTRERADALPSGMVGSEKTASAAIAPELVLEILYLSVSEPRALGRGAALNSIVGGLSGRPTKSNAPTPSIVRAPSPRSTRRASSTGTALPGAASLPVCSFSEKASRQYIQTVNQRGYGQIETPVLETLLDGNNPI